MDGVERRETDPAGKDVAVVPFHIRTITGAYCQPAQRRDFGTDANVLRRIFALETFGFGQIAISGQRNKIVVPGGARGDQRTDLVGVFIAHHFSRTPVADADILAVDIA